MGLEHVASRSPGQLLWEVFLLSEELEGVGWEEETTWFVFVTVLYEKGIQTGVA